MAYPRRSSRTPRSRFTLGLLLLTAVTLLVLDLPGTGPLDPVRGALSAVFRPVRALGNAAFEPLSNGWKGAFGYGDVEDENDELRRQLEELKGEEAEIARLRSDNAELRKLNDIKIAQVPTVAAKVITGPITSFEQTIEIDVGADHKVKKGMAVVTGGGVLGRVLDVKSTTSTVELITDPSVRIGVSTKSGDIGLSRGQGRDDPLLVTGILPETRLREGDFIYTSGIDRTAFPGDLYVGKVAKISKGADGTSRVVEVDPSADFSSRYVRVVLKEAPP